MAVGPMPEQLENRVSEVDAVPLMVNFNYLLAFLDPAQTGLSAANFDSTLRLLINAEMHGQIEGGTDLHDASAVSVLDSALNWDDTEVESILAVIGTFLGDSGTGGSLTRGAVATYVGYDFDATTEASVSIVVPADTATTAIKVTLTAELFAVNSGATAGYTIPISLNGTALSTSGSPDGRFHAMNVVVANNGETCTIERTMILDTTTVPGIDFAVTNTILAGPGWQAAGGGSSANISMVVEAI